MKRYLVCAALVAAVFAGHADAQQTCFTGQKVRKVGTGYVNYPYGADNGNAIYFTLENGRTYPINFYYNLNDMVGPALHRVLLLALSGGNRITGVDHNGAMCDDIDEIWIDG